MKKLLSLTLMACLLGSLSACDPGAGLANAVKDGVADKVGDKVEDKTDGKTDGAVTIGSISKAQYLKLIECSMVKANPDSGQKLFETFKASIDSIPDATWNTLVQGAGAASYQAQFDAAVKAGCSA